MLKHVTHVPLKDSFFFALEIILKGNQFCYVSLVVSSGIGGRGELSLAEVQCHLDKEGASDLVIDLIMNATSDRIFQESILLAIALLEGGNTVIQVSRGLLSSKVHSTNTPVEGICEE